MAAAQDWRSLSGDDLYRAFRDNTFEYDDGAVQRFGADGRTTYSKSPAWSLDGLWWVKSDLLCFVVDPLHPGACFRVHRDSDGMQLQLEPEDGGTLQLRYRQED